MGLAWSGEAVYGVDYTVIGVGGALAVGGASVMFDDGVASVTLTVTPVDDVVAETAESVLLAVVAGTGYVLGAPSSAVAEIVSDDDAPVTSTVGVSVTDGTGSESADPLVFTVGRVGDLSAAVVIGLAWSGTAIFGVDYTVSATGGSLSSDGGALTLAAGAAGAVVTVTPLDDAVVEATEPVVLTALAGTGYVLGAQTSASGTIADNDVAPTLPVVGVVATDAIGAETRAGELANTVTFTLIRSGDTARSLVVSFGWFGTAKLGKDFTAEVVGLGSLSKTTVTFAAGQDTLTILISPIDDTTVEALETVIFTLKTGTGYTVGAASSATGTIADNDGKSASTSFVRATAGPADAVPGAVPSVTPETTDLDDPTPTGTSDPAEATPESIASTPEQTPGVGTLALAGFALFSLLGLFLLGRRVRKDVLDLDLDLDAGEGEG